MAFPHPGRDRPQLRAVPDSPPKAEPVPAIATPTSSPQGWGPEATASMWAQARDNSAIHVPFPTPEKRRFGLPKLPKGWLRRLVTPPPEPTFSEEIAAGFAGLGSGSPDEVSKSAQDNLAAARTAYADSIARRHSNALWKNGNELNIGTYRDRFDRLPGRRRKRNTQHQYEIAIEVMKKVVSKQMEDEAGALVSGEDKKELEKSKNMAILGALVGPEDDTSRNQGELFALIAEIETRRKLRSGFYEERNGHIVEKDGKFAQARLQAYRKWNDLFEREELQSWAGKAAVLGLGSAALVLTAGVAGAGLGVAAAAGIGGRYAKTWGLTRLRKQSDNLRIENYTQGYKERIEDSKLYAYASLNHSNSNSLLYNYGSSQLLDEIFTAHANEQSRKNKAHLALALGSSAVAGLVTVAGVGSVIPKPDIKVGLPNLPDLSKDEPPAKSLEDKALELPRGSYGLDEKPPGIESPAPPDMPDKPDTSPLPDRKYVHLRSGQNPWQIAHDQLQSHGYRHNPEQVAEYLHRLMVLNELDEEEARHLPVGFRLRLSPLRDKS